MDRRLFDYCAVPRAPKDPANLAEQLQLPALRNDYGAPFAERYPEFAKAKLHVRFGDNTDRLPVPTVVKTRAVGDPNGVLLPLNRRRHWCWTAATVARHDLPFARKRMTAVWRGATTGKRQGFARHPRTQLVRRWCGKGEAAGVDVAYSEVVQGKHAEARRLLKPKLSMRQQLEHALIVSVEGNDVASNLKWILLSNSVPVMPRPRYESWLLESRLEPMVHYVPVRPDFADLGDAVAWCRANPRRVEAMARAGQRYMAAFADAAAELALEKRVLRRYLGREPYGMAPAASAEPNPPRRRGGKSRVRQ